MVMGPCFGGEVIDDGFEEFVCVCVCVCVCVFSEKKRGKGKALVSDTKIITFRERNHRFCRIKMDHKSNSISHHHYFNDELDAQKETPFIQRNPFLLP